MGNQTVRSVNSNSQQNNTRLSFLKMNRQSSLQNCQKYTGLKGQRNQISIPKNSSFIVSKQILSNKPVIFSRDSLPLKNKDVKFNIDDLSKQMQEKSVVKIDTGKTNLVQNLTDRKIFIFDWDDTLFFSTQLRLQKSYGSKLKISKQTLKEYDRNVAKILSECLLVGEVYIVTNSKEGWVKYSCELFLPITFKIIFNLQQITVILSRPKPKKQSFEVRNLNKWKYVSFKQIIQNIVIELADRSSLRINLHLICVGDSREQIDASKDVYEQFCQSFANFYIKTIKLKDQPDIDDLIEQQNLFLSRLKMISNTNKKLCIRFERSIQR